MRYAFFCATLMQRHIGTDVATLLLSLSIHLSSLGHAGEFCLNGASYARVTVSINQSINQSIAGIFIAPPTKHGRRRLTM